jgi:hypothetical protein
VESFGLRKRGNAGKAGLLAFAYIGMFSLNKLNGSYAQQRIIQISG